jgi:hypothetical protein
VNEDPVYLKDMANNRKTTSRKPAPRARHTRRDFSRFVAVAIGGLAAGIVPGQDAKPGQESKKTDTRSKVFIDPVLLIDADPHVCRGLNSCKGKGKEGGNACAGQGSCATAPAITCSANNSCKGKGGCGGYPGQNTCKGHGECAVPLKKEIWDIARKQFEQLMKAQGRTIGKPPAK